VPSAQGGAEVGTEHLVPCQLPLCLRAGGQAAWGCVSHEGRSCSWQKCSLLLGQLLLWALCSRPILTALVLPGCWGCQPSSPSPPPFPWKREVPARALQLQMFILHKNSTKWEAVLHPELWEKKGRLAGRERVKEKRGNVQCHPAQWDRASQGQDPHRKQGHLAHSTATVQLHRGLGKPSST